jgi:hypothetical protein
MEQVTNVEINAMKKNEWDSFDQSKIKAFNAWSVILPIE